LINRDEGKTRFLDGMRVALEHLDNLQDTLLTGLIQLRQSIGPGKVCWGLKTQASDAVKVSVAPGVAFDRQARPLIIASALDLAVDFSAAQTLYLVAAYVLATDLPVNGVPTILLNNVKVETRAAAPPYADDAVVFAQLLAHTGGFDVVQKGDWYLAALDHNHTGQFLEDASRPFHFDGFQVGIGPPRYDSGFLTVGPGKDLHLGHGLNTPNLLVQVQSRSGGVISTQGIGTTYWYELPSQQELRLHNAGAADLDLRAMLWPLDTVGAGPIRPVANAGDDRIVEFGKSFSLDGGRSAAFGGRKLIQFIWTQLS
jgi:hypothetical protein